jgi:SAM-dependent methyltransferase
MRVRVGGRLAAASAETPGRHRASANVATMPASRAAGPGVLAYDSGRTGTAAGMFSAAALDYAGNRPGQTLVLLQAGCTTGYEDLDTAALARSGCDTAVSFVEDDTPAARAAVAANPELGACALSDLRMAPLVPRSADIVHCALLQRISNAELVLDRLVETLKPGGLLLLRTGDRDSALGFLDRILPGPLRALVWRSLHPGEPGPYPAVYERLASGRGIQSYALRRGLVIVQHQTLSLLADRQRPLWLLAACRLAASLSRGRLTAAHDQLRYVIRKPESHFARLL